MKRLAFVLLALVVATFVVSGLASGALPFREDYEGINQAAGSVLMLLVYDQQQGTYIATGSGFVAFDGATLITNYHVVEDGELVLAESDNGQSYFLDQVIAADKATDLAILRFKSDTRLKPLPLRTEGGWLRGQPVVAIGSPEGFRNTVSKGDISALFTEDGVRFIQFTAPISHGSSGGALFDDAGRVIGITSSSIMGDSQNLNFAIDIREAVALYERADKSELTALGKLGAQPARPDVVLPEEAPAVKADITGLTAKQIRPDTVELTWEDKGAQGGTYFIGYEVEDNPYYSYLETKETTLEVEDLVPGHRYSFFIATSLPGLDSPQASVSLDMAEALPYQERGVEVLSLGLHYIKQGKVLDLPLPAGLDSITTGQLERARQEMELCFIYRIRLDAAPDVSTGNCLYVLTSPTGKVYTGEFYYQYDAEWASYIRRADLREMLDDVISFEEAFTPGEWLAAVYHDGALLGETRFTVAEGGAETPETPGGGSAEDFAASLRAKSRQGDALLSWAAAQGASEYRVYRATSLNGHFFFLESTTTTSHTDSNVVSGRTYFYRVDALMGDGTLIKGETVTLEMPKAGTEDATVIEEGEEPGLPLRIGEQAYVGDSLNPYIDPDLENIGQKVVTGVTLAYFGEDQGFHTLSFGDTGKIITYFSFDLTVPPGEIQNPGKVSLKQYGATLRFVYVAVSEIRFEDGSVLQVPDHELVFDSWTLD